jgi:hypothetical protein
MSIVTENDFKEEINTKRHKRGFNIKAHIDKLRLLKDSIYLPVIFKHGMKSKKVELIH